MKTNISVEAPLQSILWTGQIFYNVILVILGSFFLALASQFAIPLQPVPITLQTLVVLFLGMTYGWQLGSWAVFLYLIEGLVGLPVFSGAMAGINILFGASGGYLLGFLPAAFLSGILVEKGWGRNPLTTAAAALLGLILIFAFGLIVLSIYTGWKSAFHLGLTPFLPGEMVKLVILALVVPYFWRKRETN